MSRPSLAVIAGLFLASIALRPQLLAIGPLLPFMRADLGLSAGVAGLLTTIPVLCMGIFAPIGPRVAARLGPRNALAACIALIIGFGLVRAVAPDALTVLAATVGIGVGVGIAGAVPSMIVSGRLPGRPALGTGAYAGGIVLGSTIAAAVAVPLAGGGVEGDWRRALEILSLASIGALVAWLLLVRGDGPGHDRTVPAPRLPWGSGTAWLLVVVFGLQSILYYGAVAWLPNIYVERGWRPTDAGALVAVFNGIGLLTTVGLPLVADRLGPRRPQLLVASVAGTAALVGIVALPDLAFAWVAILGLALGGVFPLVLTLPLDVADDARQVGAVAALMLLGGYVVSSTAPVLLGLARDVTGSFDASLLLLVAFSVVLVASCALLSPARLHRGIRRAPVAGAP